MSRLATIGFWRRLVLPALVTAFALALFFVEGSMRRASIGHAARRGTEAGDSEHRPRELAPLLS